MPLAASPREARSHGRPLRRRESFGSLPSAPADQGVLALPVSAQSLRLPPPGSGNDAVVDLLSVGNGMFGAAIARYLAPYAKVTVAGPEARADGPGGYGAHHDEGRIIGDLSRDPVWSELNRRARDGMTELDPALITSCGALTATTGDGPGYLSVAAQLREHGGVNIGPLPAAPAGAGYPMIRFGPDDTILPQPAAGHFSPRRYVALAMQSAQGNGAAIASGTVRALHTSAKRT